MFILPDEFKEGVMNISKSKIFFLAIILTFLLSFFTYDIYSAETTSSKADVCIIYAKSNYKLKLADKIEKRLIKENVTVVKDLIINIKDYDPSDYKVIVILSGIAVFNPYPRATSYIKKHDYAKNIIYFCAAYVPEAVYGFLDSDRIDAITAASKEDNLEDTTEEIVAKIFELIGNSI